VRAPSRSAALAGIFLGVAVVATFTFGSPAHADSATPFEQAERSAVLELYAAESAVARAHDQATTAHRRLAGLQHRERALRRNTRIVRDSYAVTQIRIAAILRALYEGEQRVDVLAIVFGAESLDAALEGLDGLTRAAEFQSRLAREAQTRGEHLRTALVRLSRNRQRLTSATATADAATRRLEDAAAAKATSLDSIRREHNLSQARVERLAKQAATAEDANAQLEAAARASETDSTAATAEAPPPPPPPAAADGTRQLVVDAVAYHLPGHTASGLPVGMGVIAVDPTVIPLGTRVFVPGYGPAVAADTGSAIKGLIIDLWMPTTAQAQAWGRRTVTITIYG
jgi:3D (Asp-Asp-Asp) domain-containing protein